MRRSLRWAFNILAATSAALLVHVVVVNLARFALTDPVWLDVYARDPEILLPVVVYSILPLAWLIVAAIRWRASPRPAGFVVPRTGIGSHEAEAG